MCTLLGLAIREEFPAARLQLFGSSGNNFCGKDSDLDLCLIVPEETLYPDPRDRTGA